MNRRRYIVGGAALIAAIAVVAAIAQRQRTVTSATHDNTAPVRSLKSVVLAPTSSVAGVIRDTAGASLAGATVCAQTRDRSISCATSNADGAYAIDHLFAATYEVSAAAPKFRPTSYHPGGDPLRTRFALGEGERRTGIDIALDGTAVELRGTVLDVSGGPIAHARVRVAHENVNINEWRHWYPATETADDGTFTLWVAAGERRLEASADGYASVEQDAQAPGRVELLLIPGGSIAGTVVDHEGKPVADALVVADWIDEHKRARSDDTGHFEITGLVPARYDVSAHTANAYGTAVGSVLVGLAAHVDGIIVRVDPAAHIVGRVVTKPPSTLCPAADLDVTLHDPFGDNIEMTVAADGTVHADGVMASTYYANVRCRGYIAADRYPPVVIAAADQELTWNVAPGITLHGHVRTPDGAGIEDAIVEVRNGFHSYDATSSRDGSYEIGGIRPGVYRVWASSEYADVTNTEMTLDSNVEKDFVLGVPATIRGIVVDADNHPVSSVEIRAEGKGLAGRLDASRPDGTFELRLAPGTYDVYAAVDWRHPLGKKERVTVSVDKPASVRLVVPAQTGTIKGDVSDAFGRPVSDAFVYAYTPSMFGNDELQIGWNEHPTLTAPDGTFTITGLGPGTYTVIAQRRGGGSTRVTDIERGSKVSLVLAKTASLSGRISYTDHTHPSQMKLTVRADTAADRFFREQRFYHTDGVFTLDELPAGTVTIAVETPDGLGVASVLLTAGEQRRDVALTVDRSVTITGRVVEQLTHKGMASCFVIPRSTRALLGAVADYMDVTHQTDADGTFKMLAPPGEVALEISSTDETDRELCAPPVRLDLRSSLNVGDIALVRPRTKIPSNVGFTLSGGTVDSVAPKGPAAAAGLRVGDVVTSIDGVGPASFVAECGFALIAVPPRTTLTLTLARGDTIKITSGDQPAGDEIEIDEQP
ncbi:MAG TPA: carboxypeptidase-like regulatory domain-containing protein [Kofleriaceae bacterium]|nr:carboxypeptidase-like regulatory domain-containing protein [Kofleriaceae bacterium]